MADSGREVLEILIDEISNLRVRAIIVRRYQAMIREVNFLATRANHHDLSLILQAGWTLDRLRIVCALNSFYQEVIGPLMSSSRKRSSKSALAGVAISFGTTRFDEDRAKDVRSMHYDFFRKFDAFGADIGTMTAATAGSLIFVLANKERERDS